MAALAGLTRCSGVALAAGGCLNLFFLHRGTVRARVRDIFLFTVVGSSPLALRFYRNHVTGDATAGSLDSKELRPCSPFALRSHPLHTDCREENGAVRFFGYSGLIICEIFGASCQGSFCRNMVAHIATNSTGRLRNPQTKRTYIQNPLAAAPFVLPSES